MAGGGGRRKPPFASGEIAGDYEPLFAYWEEAKSLGDEEALERATLSREDFDELERMVSGSGRMRLTDLLEELRPRFEGRVDPGIAAKAYERMGIRVGPAEAKRMIAELLAAWLVEAGEYWGMLRLSKPWRGRQTGGDEQS